MLLIDLAVSLAITMAIALATLPVAQAEMASLRSTQDLRFYSQDVARTNAVFQKLISPSVSFRIYQDHGNAENATSSALTPTGGQAIRMSYAGGRPDGVLYYDGASSLIYKNIGGNSWTLLNSVTSASFSVSAASDQQGAAAGMVVATVGVSGYQVIFYAERF
jgi:hypothetical protein